MHEEENCPFCSTYNVFQTLVGDGIDAHEAFELSLDYFIENFVDGELENAYDVGYKDATSDIAEIVVAYKDAAAKACKQDEEDTAIN